jgi:endonuclease G
MVDRLKVEEALRRVQERDETLGKELDRQLEKASQEIFTEAAGRDAAAGLTPETIVLRTGRPVLAIRQSTVDVQIDDPDSEVWRTRLANAGARLARPIRGVGRIEVQGHPSYSWLGTGWLVRPDILVTNRHVAAEFTRRNGTGMQFRLGIGKKAMSARVDFLEELDSTASSEFSLTEVLHVEDEDGPDLAFFKVGGRGLAPPIILSERRARENELVAVIGYPARDSRIPEQNLMSRLFGDVYDKKRLAPGQITGADAGALLHDCSTLGGNSGSAVISLASGEAVALHFAGRFLEANFAVASDTVAEHLHRVERGAPRLKPEPKARPDSTAPVDGAGGGAAGNGTLSFTIPLQVTIRVDLPAAAAALHKAAPKAPVAAGAYADGEADAGEGAIVTEGRAEDYRDRSGYAADFLGDGNLVPMPTIIRAKRALLRFSIDGNEDETELRYRNFSVMMNRERRMCFYSAANVDGKLSRKTKRTGWTMDPRIPKEFQIKGECYGTEPKFSRGHMTRREDPAWGSPDEAQRGNADSMHVTNAVPQMQPFNAGIWLSLEDYALDHVREDDMRICVITGPVFADDDPLRYGVRIPVQFWKVIAFVHDRTGQLSATGYSISQAAFLKEEEFVFGAYETHQRSLSWIESVAGLSFGGLTAADRYGQTESPSRGPLRSPDQIQWT